MITKRDINTIESLLLFMAVTQHSNKRKASEALNTSVDTINKYIDNLEQDLSLKLLYSDSRGTNLTENGRKILASAEQITDIIHSMYSATIENTDALSDCSGKVRVAMSLGINANLRPGYVRDFFDRYPDISVISTVTPEAPKLDDMTYDIALTNRKPTSPNVVVIREIKVEYGFFASPEYLDAHGYPIDFDEMIAAHRILTTADSADYISGWKDTLKKARFVNFNTTSHNSLVALVHAGLGIAALPLFYKREGLVCLDNLFCESSLKFYLCAHKNVKDIPRVRAVINFYTAMLDKIAEVQFYALNFVIFVLFLLWIKLKRIFLCS